MRPLWQELKKINGEAPRIAPMIRVESSATQNSPSSMRTAEASAANDPPNVAMADQMEEIESPAFEGIHEFDLAVPGGPRTLTPARSPKSEVWLISSRRTRDRGAAGRSWDLSAPQPCCRREGPCHGLLPAFRRAELVHPAPWRRFG